MGRAKLSLVPISKERIKTTTFNKRKAGLFKKVYEFTKLCGVEACIIVYGPQPNSARPETWPEDPNHVRRILRRSSATCRGKNTQDLSDFFEKRKKTIDREIAKQRLKNWRAQYPSWDARLDALSQPQLTQFLAFLDAKLERAKIIQAGAKQMTLFNQNNYYSNGTDFYNADCIISEARSAILEKRREEACPVPAIDMKMKAIQYEPCLNQDGIDPPSSSMLMLVNNTSDGYNGYNGYNGYGYDYEYPVNYGNSFHQYYASGMGVYNNGDSFRYEAPRLTGNSTYQYGLSNGSSNYFQSYTALLEGGDHCVSSNANSLAYYTIGGGDVGSSDGSGESKSLVYYDSVYPTNT